MLILLAILPGFPPPSKSCFQYHLRMETKIIWGFVTFKIFFPFLFNLYLKFFSQAKKRKMREGIFQLSISLEELGRSTFLQQLKEQEETEKSNCRCLSQA